MAKGILITTDRKCTQVPVQPAPTFPDDVNLGDGTRYLRLETATNRVHFWCSISNVDSLSLYITEPAFHLQESSINPVHLPFPFWNCLIIGPVLFVLHGEGAIRDLAEQQFKEILTYWMPYRTSIKGKTLGMDRPSEQDVSSDEDMSDPDDDLYDDNPEEEPSDDEEDPDTLQSDEEGNEDCTEGPDDEQDEDLGEDEDPADDEEDSDSDDPDQAIE